MLKYDLDFFSIFPDELYADPKIGKLIRDSTGMTGREAGSKIPLFRHQETVDALNRAPEHIKEFIKSFGIGLTAYDSGAPDGYYLASDDPWLALVTKKSSVAFLTPDGRKLLSTRVEPGEFSVMDFMLYQSKVQPISDQQVATLSVKKKKPVNPKSVVVLIGIFLVIVAILVKTIGSS